MLLACCKMVFIGMFAGLKNPDMACNRKGSMIRICVICIVGQRKPEWQWFQS